MTKTIAKKSAGTSSAKLARKQAKRPPREATTPARAAKKGRK